MNITEDLARIAEHERTERRKGTLYMAILAAVFLATIIAVIAVMAARVG